MVEVKLVDGDGKSIPIPIGETTLVRDGLLGINDKRLSRNQVLYK